MTTDPHKRSTIEPWKRQNPLYSFGPLQIEIPDKFPFDFYFTAALIPEALPNIKLLVNHELPDGSGNEHNITFHPRSIVSQLRATMETFSGIPQDNIYFLFKTTLLEDNRSLFEQQVGAYDRITMRDSRLTYPYPY